MSLFLHENVSFCGSKVKRRRLTRDEQGQLVTAQAGMCSLYIVVADLLGRGFQGKVNQFKV